MTFRTENEIYDIVRRFEDRTIPKSEWNHAAHLTVGLYYCIHHSFGVAKNLMSDGIYWLNDAHGTPNTDTGGYHETLTVFWLRHIADQLKANDDVIDLVELANGILKEICDASLPLRYYSKELLFSPEARHGYVPPDLIIDQIEFHCTLQPVHVLA